MLYFINKSNGQDSLYRLFLESAHQLKVHNKGGLLLPEKDDSLIGVRFEPIYSH